MNKSRELAWWVEFGQIDFNNYREGVVKKWKEAFDKKMTEYQSYGGILSFDSIMRRFDFSECKLHAEKSMEVVRAAINSGEDVDPLLEFSIGLGSSSSVYSGKFHVMDNSKNIVGKQIVPHIFNKLLHGVQRDQFEHCRYSQCENIYFPYSKIEKLYCSSRCSTLAAQERSRVVKTMSEGK